MGIYAPFYVLYDVPCLNGGEGGGEVLGLQT